MCKNQEILSPLKSDYGYIVPGELLYKDSKGNMFCDTEDISFITVCVGPSAVRPGSISIVVDGEDAPNWKEGDTITIIDQDPEQDAAASKLTVRSKNVEIATVTIAKIEKRNDGTMFHIDVLSYEPESWQWTQAGGQYA